MPADLRRRLRGLSLALFFGLAGCDAGTPTGPDAADGGEVILQTVRWSRDLRPMLAARCGPCHGPGSVTTLDITNPFDPDEGMVNRVNTWFKEKSSPFELIVKPFAPDESFLIYKVEHPTEGFDEANNGAPMPPTVPLLTETELASVRTWIADGANDDAFFRDTVAPIFGTAVTLGRSQGKCTLCHFPGATNGLDVLDVFHPETGLVSVPSALSTKLRVAPGAPDQSFLMEKLEGPSEGAGQRMPLNYGPLDEAQIALLRTWIAEGARDN